MVWRQPRNLRLFFGAATLLPIVALSWLGLRIVQQEHAMERQRVRERSEVAAGRLALDIDRRFQEIEEQLARGQGIALAVSNVEEPQPSSFAISEAAEFQHGDLRTAERGYSQLAASSQTSVRAAALVRLGRVLRKQGNRAAALHAYSQLEKLGTVTVEGQPAQLLAYQARGRIWEETNDRQKLREEATMGVVTLEAGPWGIDRTTFDYFHHLFVAWGAPPVSRKAIARAEALLELRRGWATGSLAPRGRIIVSGATGVRAVQNEPVVAIWNAGVQPAVAWLSTVGEFASAIRPMWDAQHLDVSLLDVTGQVLLGNSRPAAVSLTPGETHLPFILSVSSTATIESNEASRRLVLISGLSLTMLLMLGAAYGLSRSIQRELRLAQQQADFVSAVSHEFRTPLTSMRHLTDLLLGGAIQSERRKTQYYELLAEQTERLHRMVESLLSFGRIEAGAYACQRERFDLSEFLFTLLDEFRTGGAAERRDFSCEVDPGLSAIDADREALASAVWNLLENAVKYSDPGTPIRVFARASGSAVQVGVEDRGPGIPAGEREIIFQKFVRGAEAKRAGVRGVGIGLTLVRQIAEAHGGVISLDSAPGRGSTFTLVLPLRVPK